MNPYNPFPTSIPVLSARRILAQRVIDSLKNHNVSVVGRKHYGKSVLLRYIAEQSRKSGSFAQVVEWDLRHFIPEEDADFFRELSEQICEQLAGSFGEDLRAYMKTPAKQTASGIREVLKLLNENGDTLLLVLDGLDGPLSSTGLSKNVWDHLCSFTDLGSLRLLAGSRERLRELCINPDSKTSDFFRRFEDPPTLLKAFSDAEVDEYLAALGEIRPIDKGARSEFFRQSGRIPVLCAAMAKALFEAGEGVISQPDVREVANRLGSEGSESIPEAFDALTEPERMGFAELCARGTLKAEQGRLSKSLVDLGAASGNGLLLQPASQLLADFVEAQSATLCSMHDLFGQPDAFERNAPSFLRLRYAHITSSDEGLHGLIENALARLDSPTVFFIQVRAVVEQAIGLVWASESTNGEMPRFTSSYGLKFLNECDQNRLPAEVPKQLRALDLLTDPRNGVKPKRANRKIYCLLNSLKAYGDLGQHQQGVNLGVGIAATVCLSMIELANELEVSRVTAAPAQS